MGAFVRQLEDVARDFADAPDLGAAVIVFAPAPAFLFTSLYFILHY